MKEVLPYVASGFKLICVTLFFGNLFRWKTNLVNNAPTKSKTKTTITQIIIIVVVELELSDSSVGVGIDSTGFVEEDNSLSISEIVSEASDVDFVVSVVFFVSVVFVDVDSIVVVDSNVVGIE